MRKPTRRMATIATAGAAVALGIGGFAYAAGDDPAPPEQGYVVVENGPDGTDTGADSGGQDCPDKNQGESPSTDPQGQA